MLKLSHTVIDIADNPRLWHLFTLTPTTLAAFLKKLAIKLHTITLRRPHWLPVIGLIVGDQNAANNA